MTNTLKIIFEIPVYTATNVYKAEYGNHTADSQGRNFAIF